MSEPHRLRHRHPGRTLLTVLVAAPLLTAPLAAPLAG